MKFILTIIFIFLFAFSADAQCDTLEDCNRKLSDASQMLNKLLDINQANTDALKSKTGEIEALQKLVKTLEESKLTPCGVAIGAVKNDLTFWLEKLGADETKNKEVLKILKDVRKQGRSAIKAQCGVSGGSVWKTLWEGTKLALPVAAILIANE